MIMGFLIHTVEGGHVPAFEYHPVSAIKPEVGMALVFSSGKLAKAGATVKPEFICMMEAKEAMTAGDIIPVIRVTPDVTFGVPTSVANTVALGSKVTIASDAMNVTATTDSGVAKIVGREGTKVGDIQYVRFE